MTDSPVHQRGGKCRGDPDAMATLTLARSGVASLVLSSSLASRIPHVNRRRLSAFAASTCHDGLTVSNGLFQCQLFRARYPTKQHPATKRTASGTKMDTRLIILTYQYHSKCRPQLSIVSPSIAPLSIASLCHRPLCHRLLRLHEDHSVKFSSIPTLESNRFSPFQLPAMRHVLLPLILFSHGVNIHDSASDILEYCSAAAFCLLKQKMKNGIFDGHCCFLGSDMSYSEYSSTKNKKIGCCIKNKNNYPSRFPHALLAVEDVALYSVLCCTRAQS